jgi:hypothetical protein
MNHDDHKTRLALWKLSMRSFSITFKYKGAFPHSLILMDTIAQPASDFEGICSKEPTVRIPYSNRDARDFRTGVS